eukprot:2984505-Pleurochrysis_carterae.AAC.1
MAWRKRVAGGSVRFFPGFASGGSNNANLIHASSRRRISSTARATASSLGATSTTCSRSTPTT